MEFIISQRGLLELVEYCYCLLCLLVNLLCSEDRNCCLHWLQHFSQRYYYSKKNAVKHVIRWKMC